MLLHAANHTQDDRQESSVYEDEDEGHLQTFSSSSLSGHHRAFSAWRGFSRLELSGAFQSWRNILLTVLSLSAFLRFSQTLLRVASDCRLLKSVSSSTSFEGGTGLIMLT